MAEGIFQSLVGTSPYKGKIKIIDSAGTGAYHTGAEPDERTMSTLRRHGINSYDHAARKVRDPSSQRPCEDPNSYFSGSLVGF